MPIKKLLKKSVHFCLTTSDGFEQKSVEYFRNKAEQLIDIGKQ
jgi:hypothetical protein